VKAPPAARSRRGTCTTGQDVVLKQIAVRGARGWKAIESFEREVAVLRVLDHPGVPRFVDAFETEDAAGGLSLVLVMERIEGESLLARIRRRHHFTEAEARTLLGGLLATLEYLHGCRRR
jgi:serine/threonine protein kinase